MKTMNNNYSLVARMIWIAWYCFWYPIMRVLLFVDYATRRIMRGWGMLFTKYGFMWGMALSFVVLGSTIVGIPYLFLWYHGRYSYQIDYLPKLQALHNDWYNYSKAEYAS